MHFISLMKPNAGSCQKDITQTKQTKREVHFVYLRKPNAGSGQKEITQTEHNKIRGPRKQVEYETLQSVPNT